MVKGTIPPITSLAGHNRDMVGITTEGMGIIVVVMADIKTIVVM